MLPNPDLSGQTLQQTYRLERLIGMGAMGAVYEASHARLSRRFAVKVLNLGAAKGADDEAAARFSREAEVTSRLKHPNIVDIIDFNHTPDGVPFIVMELLEGTDLQQRLEQVRRLSPEQTAPIKQFEEPRSGSVQARRRNGPAGAVAHFVGPDVGPRQIPHRDGRGGGRGDNRVIAVA